MTTELMTHEAPQQMVESRQAQDATWMGYIERLMSNPNSDPDKLEKFMGLWAKQQDREAEQEFNAAYAAAQSEIKPIAASGRNNALNSKYMKYENIHAMVQPVLGKHGLSLFHNDAGGADGFLRVITTLRHDKGHSLSITSPPMPTAAINRGVNACQAIIAAQTYAKRVNLCNILFVAVDGEDDDGAIGGGGVITDAQAAEIKGLLAQRPPESTGKFLAHFNIACVEALPSSKYAEAASALRPQTENGRAA